MNQNLKLKLLLLFSAVCLIPVSQFLSVRVIAILFLLSFFIKKETSKSLKRLIFGAWDIVIFILCLLIGISYSAEFSNSLHVLETSFCLLALPLVFYKTHEFTKVEKHKLFKAFCLGLIISSLICLTNAFIKFISSGSVQVFFFDKLTGFMHSDPTYFSYYLIFAITFGLYLLYFNQVKKINGLIVGSLLFFFIMLMLTAGNTAFVSVLLVLAFFILKFLTEPKKTNYKIVVFSLSVIFLLAMFYVSYFGLNSFEGRNYWERFVLWEAAIKATPNLLIGVGTGDYTSVLNDYYRSHNLNQFSLSNYNAHNQFIQTLLSNGIFGLIALLIMMIRPLALSIRYQNPLGILVFFSFFIYGLTEVFLGRYQGVVFFAVMHQSFITYYQSQSKVLAVKES